jgi:hypothetical protein
MQLHEVSCIYRENLRRKLSPLFLHLHHSANKMLSGMGVFELGERMEKHICVVESFLPVIMYQANFT